MASLALAFDVIGRDKGASKTLDKIGDKSEKTSKRIGGAFGGLSKTLVGAFAGVAAVSVFKGFISEAEESRRVGRLTAQVIKSTGGVAAITAKQVGKLATAISNKTGIDDEAIQSGENLLLTFTGIRNEVGKGNKIFDRATGIITDMSVALGQDMKSSAIQVGKALNDPIKGVTALQRVGVSFTKSQKDQIKTLVESGKTLDAQKIILAELGREFGGAAQAAATPTQKLKVSIDNLKEAIGTALLPVIDKVASFLATSFIPSLAKLGGFLTKTLGPAFGAVKGAAEVFFSFLKGNDTGVDGPFRTAAVAGQKLRDLITKKILPAFRALVDFIKQDVMPIVGTIAGAIQDGLDTFVPNVAKLASNLAAGIARTAAPIIDGVRTGLDSGDWRPLGKSVGDALVKAVNGAGAAIGKIAAAIGAQLGKVDWVSLGVAMGRQAPSLLIGLALGILNFDFGGLLKGLGKHWLDVLLAILTFAFAPAKFLAKISLLLRKIPFAGRLLAWGFDAFAKFSKKLGGWAVDALKALGKAFVKGFRGEGAGIIGSIRKFLNNIVTFLYVHVDDFAKAGLRFIKGLGDGILKGAEDAGRAVRTVTDKILGWLRTGLLAAANAALSALKAQWRAIIEILAAPVRTAVALLRGLIAGIEKLIGPVLSFIRSAWSKVTSYLTAPFSAALTTVSSMLRRIPGFASSVVDTVRSVWRSVTSAITGPISTAVGAVRTKLGDVVGFVSGLGARITAAAKNIWSGLTSGLRNAINAIIKMWNGIDFRISISVPNWVPGIGGKGWQSGDLFPDIPLLATGALVPRSPGGRLVRLGDGLEDEAVLPLSKLRKLLTAGSRTTPATSPRTLIERLEYHAHEAGLMPERRMYDVMSNIAFLLGS